MTTTSVSARIEADGIAHGWYFYGITRPDSLAAVMAELDGDVMTAESDYAAPLQLLEYRGLAAVVRPVHLADFSQAVLQERLRNESALEAMVRRHNGVIEAIHARQPILPAKFGTVYADAEEIVSALQPAHDVLLHQLDRLDGRDEWAVHLYADRDVVRARVAVEDPELQRLRNERAVARPGRAYFLEQQLRDKVETATEQALSTLAQEAFDRLAGSAVAGQVNPAGSPARRAGEVEILRASFLVARDSAWLFEAEVSSLADTTNGLRCDCSGPWAPYSFAGQNDEAAS